MKIKLFTHSYPFGQMEQFLHDEVTFLADKGVELTIVPFDLKGQIRDLPQDVKIDQSMALMLKRNSESKVFPLIGSTWNIIKALSKHKVVSLTGLRDVVGFAHHGRIVRNWAKTNIKEDDILYTYWFERITYGLASFLSKSGNNNHLITRAHGYDLYDYRRKHGFIPFRKETLEKLDQVFTVSEDGREYLFNKYGFKDKVQKAALGVKNHKVSPLDNDGQIRIVSCSAVIPLKRVDLIFDVMNSYAANGNKRVSWYHFGGGIDFEKLKKKTLNKSENLEVHLQGHVNNSELIQFYKSNFVSCFVNLSDYEGIPVSIMEAISFGIPILARNVGAIKEIVNDKTGRIMEVDSSHENLVSGLTQLLASNLSREAIVSFYQEEYDEHHNYSKFYKKLTSLR